MAISNMKLPGGGVITYDNTSSGLNSTDVQDVIDELNSIKLNKCTSLGNITDSAQVDNLSINTVSVGFVQAVTATSTLPHRNRWCTFYTFGNDVVKNQECVSDAGVTIRRWEAGTTGWTSWQTIVTRAASFLNKFNTNIVSTGNADNTVDIKMNNWGGYISYNVLLFSRFGIHAIFIQISGNQTIEILTYKTLVGSETLTLTADNTNHLVTVKSSNSWNAFGLLGFCSNVANTYDGVVVLQNMRST